MIRIDTVEPMLRSIIRDLQGLKYNLTDTKLKDVSAVLSVNISSLQHIAQEMDTCLSEIELAAAMKYENKDDLCFCATHHKDKSSSQEKKDN